MANSIDDEQDKADVGKKLDKLNNEKEDLDQIGSLSSEESNKTPEAVKNEANNDGARVKRKRPIIIVTAVTVLLVAFFGIANAAGLFHQHDWAKATCTKPKTCKECGATEGSKLGHDYVETDEAPTCTEAGKKVYTCGRCGKNYSKDSGEPATGHTPGSWKLSDDGKQLTQRCAKCNAVLEVKALTREQLDLELASQKMTVDSVYKEDSGSGYKALYPDNIEVVVTNHSNKIVRNADVIVCAWDESGLPVTVGVQFSARASAPTLSMEDINIGPNETYNCSEHQVGWPIDSNYTDRMVQFKACVSSVTYSDGTTWTNPYAKAWLNLYKDKNL